jgi:hypothetical protein
MKNVHVREFSFDVSDYLKRGIIDLHPKAIIFDYGSKDDSGEVCCFSIE